MYIKSLFGKPLVLRGADSNNNIGIELGSEFGAFKREEFIALLKNAGFKSEDLHEPTPQERRQARVNGLNALADGTVIVRTTMRGDRQEFHKIASAWQGSGYNYRYASDEILGTNDDYTVVYTPKED